MFFFSCASQGALQGPLMKSWENKFLAPYYHRMRKATIPVNVFVTTLPPPSKRRNTRKRKISMNNFAIQDFPQKWSRFRESISWRGSVFLKVCPKIFYTNFGQAGKCCCSPPRGSLHTKIYYKFVYSKLYDQKHKIKQLL